MRFGARSGAAPIVLGAVKVLLGLLFGNSLFQLLKAFPQPLLGSLLIFAGTTACCLAFLPATFVFRRWHRSPIAEVRI